jgi:uncharacterized protein
MKIVRALLLAIIATLVVNAWVAPALAQTSSPEQLQAARELAALASGNVLIDVTATLVKQVWPTIEAALRTKNPKIDAATLAELRKEFEQLQVSAINETMTDTALIYARYFTAQEMRDILAFYRTPTGAKALKIMPQATLELARALSPRLELLSATVTQRFSAILQLRGFVP